MEESVEQGAGALAPAATHLHVGERVVVEGGFVAPGDPIRAERPAGRPSPLEVV